MREKGQRVRVLTEERKVEEDFDPNGIGLLRPHYGAFLFLASH